MMKVVSVALLVVLGVCMFAPLLLISRSEIDAFQTWFEQLDMTSQSLMYAVLRLIAYPYTRDLQDALLSIHGCVGSALVVIIGELLGSGAQLTIFDTILAPLAGLRGRPQVEFIASALRGQSIGMQQSTAELYAVLGCLGDSDLMPNFIVGTVLGQFINLELKMVVMHSPEWASEFLTEALIPATRIISSMLLTYWLWQEARAVATGGGKLPEAPITNPVADIPTDVDAADEPEADEVETLLAGAATAPAGRRARSAVTSAVKAAAETVRRTGRSAKARVLRFHEAAPSMQDTLKSWTPPQLRNKRSESAAGRDDSAEPGARRTRRSTAATPQKSASVAVKKERAPGVSKTTRSRGRSHISAAVDTEEESMMTGASIGGSRKSVGQKGSTLAHRLETTLTEKVYTTPSGRQSRSRKLSQISPGTTAD